MTPKRNYYGSLMNQLMLNGKYEINNVDKDSAGMFTVMLYYTWVDLIPHGSITVAYWGLPH